MININFSVEGCFVSLQQEINTPEMVNFKKVFPLIFLLFFIANVHSQKTVLEDEAFWFTLSNKAKLNDKFYLSNIFQLRVVDYVEKTRGYFILPAINYKLNKNFSFGLGYLYAKFYSNGVNSPIIPKEEHRIWQRVSLKSSVGKTTLLQRLIFEERFRDKIVIDGDEAYVSGTVYAQRLRYKLYFTFNLIKLKNNKFLLGKITDEVRVRFKDGLSVSSFDQNELSGYIGYSLFKNSKVWLGYGRFLVKIKTDKFLSENLIHLAYSHDFDLSKK